MVSASEGHLPWLPLATVIPEAFPALLGAGVSLRGPMGPHQIAICLHVLQALLSRLRFEVPPVALDLEVERQLCLDSLKACGLGEGEVVAGEPIPKLRDMPPFSNTHVAVGPNAPEGAALQPTLPWAAVRAPRWLVRAGPGILQRERKKKGLLLEGRGHRTPRWGMRPCRRSPVSARGKRMLMHRISSSTGPERTT